MGIPTVRELRLRLSALHHVRVSQECSRSCLRKSRWSGLVVIQVMDGNAPNASDALRDQMPSLLRLLESGELGRVDLEVVVNVDVQQDPHAYLPTGIVCAVAAGLAAHK